MTHLILACNSKRLRLNLPPDLIEICELAIIQVQKLCILRTATATHSPASGSHNASPGRGCVFQFGEVAVAIESGAALEALGSGRWGEVG
jgi:hypothetical protein